MKNKNAEILKRSSSFLLSPFIGNFIAWFVASCFIAATNYINGDSGWTDNNIWIVVGLFIATVWTTEIHALSEAYKIEIKQEPITNHNVRGFLAIAIPYAIGFIIHLIGTGLHASILLEALITGAFISSVYYFFFEAFLNYYRGLPLLYVSHSPNAANIDQQISKLPDNIEPYAVAGLKILILAAASFAEFKMLFNL